MTRTSHLVDGMWRKVSMIERLDKLLSDLVDAGAVAELYFAIGRPSKQANADVENAKIAIRRLFVNDTEDKMSDNNQPTWSAIRDCIFRVRHHEPSGAVSAENLAIAAEKELEMFNRWVSDWGFKMAEQGSQIETLKASLNDIRTHAGGNNSDPAYTLAAIDAIAAAALER